MDLKPSPQEAQTLRDLFDLLPAEAAEGLTELMCRANVQAGWMSATGTLTAGNMAMVVAAYQLGATGMIDEAGLLRLLSSPLPEPPPKPKRKRPPQAAKSRIPRNLQVEVGREFLRRTESGEQPEEVSRDIHTRLGLAPQPSTTDRTGRIAEKAGRRAASKRIARLNRLQRAEARRRT
jgi:hypothetical protein